MDEEFALVPKKSLEWQPKMAAMQMLEKAVLEKIPFILGRKGVSKARA